jgi:hypothetical protein
MGRSTQQRIQVNISEIANNTFNTGKNHFSAQFTQLRKNVANYLQRTAAEEGYLVVETVRTGKVQMIALPLPINTSTLDTEDQKLYKKRQSGQLQNAKQN